MWDLIVSVPDHCLSFCVSDVFVRNPIHVWLGIQVVRCILHPSTLQYSNCICKSLYYTSLIFITWIRILIVLERITCRHHSAMLPWQVMLPSDVIYRVPPMLHAAVWRRAQAICRLHTVSIFDISVTQLILFIYLLLSKATIMDILAV